MSRGTKIATEVYQLRLSPEDKAELAFLAGKNGTTIARLLRESALEKKDTYGHNRPHDVYAQKWNNDGA